ncbi:MAG: hypothetical protein ACLQBY_10265 [Solirubrobacteraceae bacterium]
MVLAAAAFDEAGGPGGALVITEFALARPVGEPSHGKLDSLAYTAAIFLLERLHDVKHRDGAPTDIWLEHCLGATPEDYVALGFEHNRFDPATPAFLRPDTADPAHWLLRIWRRIESVRVALAKH